MASLAETLAEGRTKAEEFLHHGVDTWVEEGRIEPRRRDELVASLDAPEVERALFHAGAHFAISLPLRFPFGASARFLYTLSLRLKAELEGLLRRKSPRAARRCHTFIVMLFALLPGFGRLAYFLSPALREERLFLVVPIDVVSRKLPFQTYRRFHLASLFTYWAQPGEPGRGVKHFLFGGWFEDLKRRLGDLRPYVGFIAVVLTVDLVALGIGAYLFWEAGMPSHYKIAWFREGNVMSVLEAAHLLLAAVCGLAAYHVFWRRDRQVHVKEAAGIFLWGIGGIGLILFAIDDYFSLHEQLGRRFESSLTLLPIGVNMPDDILILGYAVIGLAVLFVFRMELFEDRPSATLLQLAAVAALIMVTADAFATTRTLEAFEYPAQTLSKGLLLLAFGVRFLEVSSRARQASSGSLEIATG